MSEQEIHRATEVAQLAEILRDPKDGLNICGISGPGGVGKSYLLNHVLDSLPAQDSKYLRLTVDGANGELRSDFFGLIDGQLLPRSLPAPANPANDYFPHVRKLAAIHRALVADVEKELSGASSDLKRLASSLLRTGQMLNKLSPKSREVLDLQGLKLSDKELMEAIDVAGALIKQTRAFSDSRFIPGPVRDLLGKTLKQRVQHEPFNATADAMLTDLSAALRGYRPEDRFKLTQRTIPGLERLLLVIDDYEALASVLGDFVVGSLIPKLSNAPFKTVLVILCRDDLSAMHPSWGQHCERYMRAHIALQSFDRDAAFALLERAGIPEARREAIYKATDGFPFLLHSMIEEESRGTSALSLQKFYDRTTRWMTPTEAGWFVRTCYLDEVNEDTLQRFFKAEEIPRVQTWFEGESSIRDPSARVFRVRGLIRDKVRSYQEVRSPSRHREMEAQGRGEGTTPEV